MIKLKNAGNSSIQSSDGHLTRTAHTILGISPRSWRFFLWVCFVCVSWSKRYSRAKSEPSSNGKTMGEGRGKELPLAPSLIGFSFDIFIPYKTLTENTRKSIATRAMLDSIRWIRTSDGQLVMIPSYRELAVCPAKFEKPDCKNADRTKWSESFLCSHYCVYMLQLIFYFS